MNVEPIVPNSSASRPAHPTLRALLGNIDLGAAALARRPDALALAPLARMLSNAEYWLSYELARFEPLLARCPSPLRELGVAVLLRYGEEPSGVISSADLALARDELQELPVPEVQAAIAEGLAILSRAVEARERVPELEQAGWRAYAAAGGLSVHALRAMGKATILVEGPHPLEELPLGVPVVLSARDERGRPLPAPEVESRLGAPLWVRDLGERREALFVVPGEYLLRVSGRAGGERRLIAR